MSLPSIETLKAWEIVFGLTASLLGAGFGAVLWIGRRLKARDDRLAGQISAAELTGRRQLDTLAERIAALDAQVDEVETRVEAIERGMETVARQADVAALRADLRAHQAEMSAVTVAMRGQLDTIYKAAIAKSQGLRPET